MPAIRVIGETLAAAHIDRVHGIVNGTTNFILTEMARTGASYEDALAQAQELGYAEADPTEDVTGKDAAAKMAIIARLAFSAPVSLAQVPLRGHREDDRRRHRLRQGVRAVAEAGRLAPSGSATDWRCRSIRRSSTRAIRWRRSTAPSTR